MTFEELSLQGAWLIKPFYSDDSRGAFIKDYNVDIFASHGIPYEIRETFYTTSKRGTIRAIHFQFLKQQPKLVRCISGHIYDVIVDLRLESPTFAQWTGLHLTGNNMNEVLVPERFGHGYLVLEDSIVSYKCAETFCKEGDSGIMYNDPTIDVEWPYEEIGGIDNLIISEKDNKLMSLKEYVESAQRSSRI